MISGFSIDLNNFSKFRRLVFAEFAFMSNQNFKIMDFKAKKFHITESEKEIVLNLFKDDIRLAFDDDVQEYWIGEKGLFPVIMLIWNLDNKIGEMICFRKTIDELRHDTQFINALFTNEDVNHALRIENGQINDEAFQEIVNWLNGTTNEMFITACGAVNYFDEYLS